MPYLTSDLLTNDELMELRECPRSLLILGGGYIALELGQMFRRFGAEVTIIDRSGQLLAHGYEPETGQVIGAIFEEEGIHIVTDASIQAVSQQGNEVVATVSIAGTTKELRAEKLLIATGRRPNTDNISLEKAGVKIGKAGANRR